TCRSLKRLPSSGAAELLSSSHFHAKIEIQLITDAPQERRALRVGFNGRDRARDQTGDRDRRQSRAGSHIYDRPAGGEERNKGSGLQDMPWKDPISLVGTEEPRSDRLVLQDLSEAKEFLDRAFRWTQTHLRERRSERCFTCYH